MNSREKNQKKENFQKLIDNKQTDLFFIHNNNLSASITNFDARLVSLKIAGNNAKAVDVVVGFDDIDGYIHATESYYGATIGRVANRIAKGKFILDNKEYTLAVNNGINHLHGGKKHFRK
jgi:aldose 1-epimerase